MNGLDKTALDRWITREQPEPDEWRDEPDDIPEQTEDEMAHAERIANETVPERIHRLVAEWAQEPLDDEGCTPGGWAKSPT